MLSRLTAQLQNSWMAIQAYSDLSPDQGLRRRIRRSHRNRSLYQSLEWHNRFWKPLGIRSDLSEFVYEALSACSGLEAGRLLPNDRLIEDLRLPLLCWFDWEMVWTEQFFDRFGLDSHWVIDVSEFQTLQEFMVGLNSVLVALQP